MKKKILIIILLVIVVLSVVIGTILVLNNRVTYGKKAFYLEDELYNTSENYEEISLSKFKKLQSDKKSYVVFTYASFCPFKTPSDKIFKSVFKGNKMKLYAIGYDKLKGNDITNKVNYAPSVMIFKKGKLVAYLNAESDDDYNRYQNKKEFKKWLAKYIYLESKK